MWTRLFEEARDGGVTPEASAYGRLQRGGITHVYDLLSGKMLAQLHTGHLRAALLAAAGDSKVIMVKVPFRYQVMNEAAITAPQLRTVFAGEHFPPSVFETCMKGLEGHFVISLFTAGVMQAAEKRHAQQQRTGSP